MIARRADAVVRVAAPGQGVGGPGTALHGNRRGHRHTEHGPDRDHGLLHDVPLRGGLGPPRVVADAEPEQYRRAGLGQAHPLCPPVLRCDVLVPVDRRRPEGAREAQERLAQDADTDHLQRRPDAAGKSGETAMVPCRSTASGTVTTTAATACSRVSVTTVEPFLSSQRGSRQRVPAVTRSRQSGLSVNAVRSSSGSGSGICAASHRAKRGPKVVPARMRPSHYEFVSCSRRDRPSLD